MLHLLLKGQHIEQTGKGLGLIRFGPALLEFFYEPLTHVIFIDLYPLPVYFVKFQLRPGISELYIFAGYVPTGIFSNEF